MSSQEHRRSLWDYYDRRVTERLPGIANAHVNWTGLGVQVSVEEIAAEASQLEQCLRRFLQPASSTSVPVWYFH